MYSRKRYNGGVTVKKDYTVLIRILISIAIAVIISVFFCVVGITLGQRVIFEDEGETTPQTNGTDEVTLPAFTLKDVPEAKAADITLAQKGGVPYNTVSVPITDENGKLIYLSSVYSLLYGDSAPSSMKTIDSAVADANIKANKISLRFTPFDLENDPVLSDACSFVLFKDLISKDVDEIIVPVDGIRPSLENNILSTERGDILLGASLDADLLFEPDHEETIRRYYSIFDFVVLELSPDLMLGIPEDTDTDTEVTPKETEAETVDGDVTDTPESPDSTVYSILQASAQTIKRYSLRVKISVLEDEVDSVMSMLDALGVGNYEIYSK